MQAPSAASRRWIATCLVWITCAVAVIACTKSAPPLKLKAGESVPALTLKDTAEKPVQLSMKSDKLLIINVWATWCGPCRHELPSLDRMGQALADSARVVGISVDEDSHVLREYLIERQIHFPSYWDPERHFARDILGVRVYPSTLFVSPAGTLIKVEEGWRDWDTPQMLAETRSLIPQYSSNRPSSTP